jgi:hypothetical protein
MKIQDSLNLSNITHLKQQDSTRRIKDSITYYDEILPLLNEVKSLLAAQVETPFKGNFEIGVGGGLSTYFGAYRSFASIIDGKYYMPSGAGILKYNFHKHLTARFEATGTQITVGPINNQIVMGALLADYNIAPNMYSIRVGMIPTVSIGYNMFGIENNSLVVGAGIKSYFTARTALEVNVRYQLTNLDEIGDSDHFVWGHLMITRKIK